MSVWLDPVNKPSVITRRDLLKSGLYAAVTGTLLTNCNVATAPTVNRPAPPAAPNVILLSIDTQRADHLGCYGYALDTSPNIDAFAAESTLYRNAFASSPWTLPSHAGMLTGIHPYTLGIDSQVAALPPETPALAALLRDAGFQTAAFVDSMPKGFIGGERGFNIGFDSYEHAPFAEGLDPKYDFAATADAAAAWMRQRDATRPFFLFMHTKSVHSIPDGSTGDPRGFPYTKPLEYMERYLSGELLDFSWKPAHSSYLATTNERLATGVLKKDRYPRERIESLIGQYDAGIAYTDEHFGRLIDFLRGEGIFDNTLFILTADHGEAFLEHRFLYHNEVYDQLLHVPLIVRPPGGGGAIAANHAALEDIAPTVLHYLGLDVPAEMTGRPLGSLSEEPRRLFGFYQFGSATYPDEFALREGPWKLVVHGYAEEGWGAELYNTNDDPAEQSPIDDLKRIAAMHATLASWTDARPRGKGVTIELDPETTEELKALGYFN